MKWRTVFCWLVVVCLTVLLAQSVAAEETSGSCGENVTWSFDESSETLTFSGTGEITFNAFAGSPWSGYMAKIQKVIFEKGISAIQDGAFANYSALKQIVFLGDKPTVKLSTFKKVTATAYFPPDNETWAGGGLVNHGGTLYWVAGEPGTSGLCGDNLNWTFQDGVLTVSGTGPMYDYGTKSWMPWLDLRNEIIKVVIEPGVSSIGCAAFANCTELQQIIIADSVQSIGGQAFLFCSKLTAVSIPDGVTTIEELVFSNCTSLSRIVIPASVTKIYADAFEGSPNLKKIYFYGAPPAIGGMNMNGCFRTVEAVAYYPVKDSRWTESIRSSYGSVITWMENLCIDGHTQTAGEEKKATCTEDGFTARQYCSACDEELIPSEVIHASGHKEATDAAKTADCTQSGLTEGKHCSECSKVLVAQQTIPMTDHNYGQWKEVKAATTEATGLEERVCSSCKKVEQREIEKLEPPITKPTEPVTQPTEPPVTKPTEPETQPTEPPATKPTEPEKQPTEPPATKPTESETQPTTSPTTRPTEPPTQSTTKPTEPSNQPTTQTTTLPDETLGSETVGQSPGTEPDSPIMVWVIVGLTAAAVVTAGGFFVFKKIKKK